MIGTNPFAAAGTSDVKSLLCSSKPLTAAEERLVLDRLHQLERDIATIQHEARVAARDRSVLLSLIADDANAMTFQSLGQYRAALLSFAAGPVLAIPKGQAHG